MIWPFKRRRPEPDDDVEDLRHIDSVRVRIKGTASLIPDKEREDVGGQVYVLRREPENDYDSNAVAIYSQGRKVGYVSATRAASLAPLLDRLGKDALINGMGAMTNSIRLWADLPRAAALRAHLDGK